METGVTASGSHRCTDSGFGSEVRGEGSKGGGFASLLWFRVEAESRLRIYVETRAVSVHLDIRNSSNQIKGYAERFLVPCAESFGNRDTACSHNGNALKASVLSACWLRHLRL